MTEPDDDGPDPHDLALDAELEALERERDIAPERWSEILRVIAEAKNGSHKWGSRIALAYLRGVRRTSRRLTP